MGCQSSKLRTPRSWAIRKDGLASTPSDAEVRTHTFNISDLCHLHSSNVLPPAPTIAPSNPRLPDPDLDLEEASDQAETSAVSIADEAQAKPWQRIRVQRNSDYTANEGDGEWMECLEIQDPCFGIRDLRHFGSANCLPPAPKMAPSKPRFPDPDLDLEDER